MARRVCGIAVFALACAAAFALAYGNEHIFLAGCAYSVLASISFWLLWPRSRCQSGLRYYDQGKGNKDGKL